MIRSKKDIRYTMEQYAEKARLDRLARQLEVTMSIMSGTQVTTHIAKHGQLGGAPAATSYETGFFGKNFLYGRRGHTAKKPTKSSYYRVAFDEANLGQDLTAWLGAAWHELGHILWSPLKALKDQGISQALNLLEDARIETLLLARWPRTRGPLLKVLGDMLNRDHSVTDPLFAYAWAAGRPHLPIDARKRLRLQALATSRPATVDRIDEIFLEYLSMGDKWQSTKAKLLERQLRELLGNPPMRTVCQGHTLPGEGTETPTDVSSIVDEMAEDQAEAASSASSAGSPTIGPNGAAVRKAVVEIAEEILAGIQDDQALQEEVRELEKLLRSTVGGLGRKAGRNEVMAPTPSAVRLARDIRTAAARFNDDSGKGLVRRQDYGRLKPMRYEMHDDLDVSYDRWEAGLDQEMHICVLMDISGSMDGKPISEVLYGLEVGLKDVATVEPILFDDVYELLAGENTATRMLKVEARGGTDPSEAASYTHGQMINSPARNRLVVIYTDGQWAVPSYAIVGAYLEEMMQAGVNVRIICERSDQYATSIIPHTLSLTHEMIHVVGNLEDLPPIVSEWTRTVLQR